jgi:hypothetical protein
MKILKISYLIILLLVNYELIYGKVIKKRQIDDVSLSFDDIMDPEVIKRWHVGYRYQNDENNYQYLKRRLFPSNLQVISLLFNNKKTS